MLPTISVKDKINLQEIIQSSAVLTEDEMHLILNRWTQLLNQHQIHIVFNQTPLNIREQYDYLANEFLWMQLPPHPNGMQFCFQYDRINNNDQTVEMDIVIKKLLEDIFKKQECVKSDGLDELLHFNEHENLSEPEFSYLIKKNQRSSKAIDQCCIFIGNKKMNEHSLEAVGKFQLGYVHQDHCEIKLGGWEARLQRNHEKWVVKALFIDGF